MRGGELLDPSFERRVGALDARDRRWTQELVYGTLRLRGRLFFHLLAEEVLEGVGLLPGLGVFAVFLFLLRLGGPGRGPGLAEEMLDRIRPRAWSLWRGRRLLFISRRQSLLLSPAAGQQGRAPDPGGAPPQQLEASAACGAAAVLQTLLPVGRRYARHEEVVPGRSADSYHGAP